MKKPVPLDKAVEMIPEGAIVSVQQVLQATEATLVLAPGLAA